MNPSRIGHFRNFFSTHSFYEGVRTTIGIMVPVLIAARYDEIGWGLAMAIGALCVSLTDNAGPIHHRVNGMLTAIVIIFSASLLTGVVIGSPLFMAMLLVGFSFTFSIIGIFGTRAASIGTASLVAVTLQMHESNLLFWQNALLIGGGGIWYFVLSISLYRIRPYKLVQQVLGDCMLETAAFLHIKSKFYDKNPDFNQLYEALLKAQADVHNKQQVVRELLFKTRSIVKESTHTGRVLVMAFLDTIDLFESIMTSQQDYKWLHTHLGHTGILPKFKSVIIQMANDLSEIGQAIQENRAVLPNQNLKAAILVLEENYSSLREQYLDADSVEAFISLRHILNSIEEIESRLDTLHIYTTYDRKIKMTGSIDYQRFVIPSYINVRLLFDNLNYNSNIFRYALRMSVAMLAGFLLSFWMPIGHSYWILLTIVVILKPAYALTRQRNRERLTGTFTGAITGALLLYSTQQIPLLFMLMLVAMVGAFSLMRTRYQISVALLTVYVLLAYYILQPGNFTDVVTDRIIDTIIGSAIALIFTFVIPPIWEREQIIDFASNAVRANLEYFLYISSAFTGAAIQNSQYKWYRKETYIALANLSDGFQRMLNEPKRRQQPGEYMHQLIVSCYVLSSHIATLSSYRKMYAKQYANPDFSLLLSNAEKPLRQAIAQLQNEPDDVERGEVPLQDTYMNEQVRQLMAQRQLELKTDNKYTETGKRLSELKTITDQFAVIIRTAGDIHKICAGLMKNSK